MRHLSSHLFRGAVIITPSHWIKRLNGTQVLHKLQQLNQRSLAFNPPRYPFILLGGEKQMQIKCLAQGHKRNAQRGD